MTTPRPRSRTILRRTGWTLATLGVLLLAVWFASGWFGAAYTFGQRALVIGNGWLEYDHQPWAIAPARIETWRAQTVRWRTDFLILSARARGGDSVIGFPLWWFAAPLALTGLLLIRLSRPLAPGHCPRCNYNLTGLPPSSPCPECGRDRTANS